MKLKCHYSTAFFKSLIWWQLLNVKHCLQVWVLQTFASEVRCWLVFSNPPWKLERCTLYPLFACHMSGQVPPCFLPLYEVQLSVYLTGCVMCEQQNARLPRFRWLPACGEVVIVMAACGKRHIKYQNIVIGHFSALLHTHGFSVDSCGLTFP